MLGKLASVIWYTQLYSGTSILRTLWDQQSVLKKRGALYREVSLYTVAVVGTCVVSVIERVSVEESAC